MRIKLKFTFIPAFLIILLTAVNAQTPRTFILDSNYLNTVKAKLASGDATVAGAYKMLLKKADKALAVEPFTVMKKKQVPSSGDKHDFVSLAPYHWPNPKTPDGLPYIRKDGQRNPEVEDFQDKEDLPKMVTNVEILSLAYFYSDNAKYAEKATQLLRTWFLDPATLMNPNLNHAQMIKGENQGRGAGIIDSRHFIRLVDAIGLLGNSKAWTKTDQQGMEKWFADYLNWLQTSENGKEEIDAPNNHGTWYDVQRLTYSLFTGNKALAESIVANIQKRLAAQLDNNLMFPKEMERTLSLHYTSFNLTAHYNAALLAESLKLNIWETGGEKSLKAVTEKLYPYLSNQKKWEGQQIKEFEWEMAASLLCTAAVKYNKPEYAQSVKNLKLDEDAVPWLILTRYMIK